MFHKKLLKSLAVAMAVTLAMTGCSAKKTDSKEPAADNSTQQEAGSNSTTAINDGTYTTTVQGRNGDVKVETTIAGGKITSVNVVEHTETAGISDGAIEFVPQRIVDANSINVDGISGATITSTAIIDAVKAAITEAGGSVSDYEVKAEAGDKEVVQMSADVVVVGAGSSGMTSAISAAQQGARVVVIEKTSSVGGGALVAWAGKGYGSSQQEALGVETDKETIIADWIENCHWRVDAAAIRQFMNESGETFDWLADAGLQTTLLPGMDGSSLHMLPTDYSQRPELYTSLLEEHVVSKGGEVLVNTTGKELLTDSEGNVTGVRAEQTDGTVVEITAKSVILATGGYAGNAEMVEEAFGFSGALGGLAQNVGEGIEMAWAVGAKCPSNFGGQMLHQTLAKATSGLKQTFSSFEASYPLMLTYLPNLMNVGKTGSRFRDEAYTMEAVAAANSSAYQGSFHYVIISKAQIDAMIESGMNGINAVAKPGMPPEFYMDFADQFALETPWANMYEVLDKMVENGDGFKGSTIEELAQNAGMDVEIFTETMTNYEEFCKTGVDTQYNKDSQFLVPMGSEGPYYAITAEINNLNSIGGLYLNTDYQVLNDENLPIKGLYAVGVESMGMLYNDTYVGNGVGLGNALTSGRLAGAVAGQEAVKED